MEGGFLQQAFVFLTAAVFSVPIAKRLGLGSVLGYLIAGVIIGPFGLGLLVEQGQDVMHFAEFGVVLMLFLVGLELEPSLLWRLRVPVVGLGGLQVLITALLGAGVAFGFGLAWTEALAIGMVLALSSTAIVLQTMQEKGLTRTAGGQSAFSVLLFQDIAVIPMLALFPLLATHTPHSADDGHHQSTLVEHLPPALQALVVLGVIVGIIAAGRFIVPLAFRSIARTRLREIFVAAALFLVIGIALLMGQVGLSPALGTFLAGVVLSSSEYRHELESDIDPFKGLLLGLFFIAVGASIDFALVAAAPLTVGGLVLGIMVGKAVLLIILGRIFRLGVDQALFFGLALAQSGEFAFVLFSYAEQTGVLVEDVTALLIVVVAITMALTPLVLLFFERVLQPRVGTKESAPAYDEVSGEAPVIIAGFGRFGQIAARLLDAEGISATVLEYDSDQVDLLRRFGRKVFYGDASRYDLLKSAGAAHAKLLILAIDQPDKTLELVHTVRKHFPQLQIIARARGRVHAYELLEAGVEHVFRETFDTALAAGVRSLELLGYRRYRVHRAAMRFRRHDEALMRRLASQRNLDDFIDRVKAATVEAEAILRQDMQRSVDMTDHGWDTESLNNDFARASSSTSDHSQDRR